MVLSYTMKEGSISNQEGKWAFLRKTLGDEGVAMGGNDTPQDKLQMQIIKPRKVYNTTCVDSFVTLL